MWIDPRLPWPHHTFIHERLHIENPSWSESKVRRETTKVWKKMTWKDKAEVLKLLGSGMIAKSDLED